jgi:hypothetical protein
VNAVIYCYSNTQSVHTDISGMYGRVQPRHPFQIVIVQSMRSGLITGHPAITG